FLEVLIALAFAGSDKEISDLRGFTTWVSGSSVPVRLRTAFRGPPGHQKILENSVLNQRHLVRRHTLVVHLIRTDEFLVAGLLFRRVIDNTQKPRKHGTIHAIAQFASQVALVSIRQRLTLTGQVWSQHSRKHFRRR